MIIALFAVAAAIGIGKLMWDDCYEIAPCIFVGILGSILGAIVGFVLSMLISLGIASNPDNIEIETTYKNLYALQDNMTSNINLNGNIFVIQGSSNDELKYFALVEEPAGYMIQEFKTSRTYVKITAKTPQLEIRNEHFKNKLLETLFTEIGCDCRYVLHIPPNSLVNMYNIDLK